MSTTSLQATVILPTHDHGGTIRFPLACLQRQTVRDFEVFVIGDGVPEEQKPALRQWVAADERFHLVDRPKHSRRGEPYRHEILQSARGRIVCYLCDRDLWLPDHLERMVGLLSTVDYGHSLPLHVLPDKSFRTFPVDLAFVGYRHMMLTMNDNRMPFSCFAHTLAAYRDLPEGWTTTPDGYWTDLHMFRKFMAQPTLSGASGIVPTAVTFPSPPRQGWTEAQRAAELETWQAQLETVEGRLRFERDILRHTVLQQREEAAKLGTLATQLQQELAHSRKAASWRGIV